MKVTSFLPDVDHITVHTRQGDGIVVKLKTYQEIKTISDSVSQRTL